MGAEGASEGSAVKLGLMFGLALTTGFAVDLEIEGLGLTLGFELGAGTVPTSPVFTMVKLYALTKM